MTGFLAFGMHTLTREFLTLTPRSSLPCSAELAARKRRRGKILGKGLWGGGVVMTRMKRADDVSQQHGGFTGDQGLGVQVLCPCFVNEQRRCA